MEAAMEEAGFEDIETYVTRSQNRFAQYIVTQLNLEICNWSAGRPGVWVSRRWWEKDILDLERPK